MSLGTRLTLKTAMLLLALVVVAIVALWGLGGLNRDLGAALKQYDRLRDIYILSNDVKVAQTVLRIPTHNPDKLRKILTRLVLRAEDSEDLISPERFELFSTSLSDILLSVDQPAEDVNPYGDASVRLNVPLGYLSAEIFDTNERIKQIQREAQVHRYRIQKWVAATATIAALLAIAVGIWQYLAVMNPLRRLHRGVRMLAQGNFGSALRVSGDREFADLANDFNNMAEELQALYRDLEDKVRLRSAQLAQSERLASVGFLAAGVAHEINNPLAIIAGEAELAIRSLPGGATDPSLEVLTAIRDEAFRCKAITQKLLSLARPGSGAREPVALRELAEEVGDLVRTLPQHSGRRVEVEGQAQVRALSDTSQVKQVLLNLVVNALEAIEPGVGVVRVLVSASGERAKLAVQDNGKGISAEALPRVFEPFYTEKKSPTTPGLGLGLSISHAIIKDLGGQLTASSQGPGQGSTFTIELPIAGDGKTE